MRKQSLAPKMRLLLRIVEDSTGKVEREFDVTGKSDRQVERLHDGLCINLNHDKFSVVQVEVPDEAAQAT